ncbi:MAG: DEAD/DEAH box helicase [Nanoarchaeota archaeon]|nr:DEAD/DEAH box helicase [Nanoarchaeota archaeon]MCG2718006.1 DEAD/DEAH box helicase [Nanoarchaeota archaeon]
MTINPIRFAHEVNEQFLRYQLTAFPLSDPDLAEQAKKMLKGSEFRQSPLVKGPYVSLTRSYKKGKELKKLVEEKIIHPAVEGVAEFPRLLSHQQEVLEAVKSGNHCLVTTGTGSGKTEAFLYPIFDHCFRLRDENAHEGIVAIIVYPMNALAVDQLARLRKMLAGTGISFGMYIGSTPATKEGLSDTVRMNEGEGPDKIPAYIERYKEHKNITIAPFEERLTEQEMGENPPRILLTNVNQLEFLMTRGKDLGMFEDAPLRFLVFDEAHTYTGAKGAEVACLIRRIRSFCHKTADEVICIGTSATITDPVEGEKSGVKFAQRFFGVDENKIALIQEKYEEEYWPESLMTPPLVGEGAQDLFLETLNAIEGEGDTKDISTVIEKLTKQKINITNSWQESVYNNLKQNKVAKTIYEILDEPCFLTEATKKVWTALGRTEDIKGDDIAELLTYLVLGAAASKEDNPLFRPKLHYFVRGLGDVSTVLHDIGEELPRAELFFSGEKALKKYNDILPTAIYPIMVCTNCGQHYFEARFLHLDSKQSGLSGGDAEGENVFWPRAGDEGTRIVFTNRFVTELETDENDASKYSEKLDKKREIAYVCRFCGTFHKSPAKKCSAPGCNRTGRLLKVNVLREFGKVKRCPSCGHRGSRFGGKEYEPFRPLSAVTVADVHILAQDMLNAEAADNKKLIIFTDNRQDAAFQAAWMANHARRYRLRHLMYKKIQGNMGPISIGDLQDHLFNTLKADTELARTLAPEVFMGEIEEAYSTKIDNFLKQYLRIQLVREVVTSFKQRDSLETWGVAKVNYYGLNEDLSEIEELAKKYEINKEGLLRGVETLLDMYRRGRYFYDEIAPIFSQYWHQGCPEVQRGFLPFMDYPPKGLKFSRDETDKRTIVTAMTSTKGQTLAENFIRKWGVDEKKTHNLLEDIWGLLTNKLNILVPTTLKSPKGKPLYGATGLYQIDSKKIGVSAQYELYRCNICRRAHTRATPRSACSTMHCKGKLQKEHPSDDDYNIYLLKKDFIMLMAKEHTAQVPAKDRQKIEGDFKKPGTGANCLVATPTLELGVDIGDLDMILMRNVPPLPSNYWQRAGRAGRRYRMAVVYTYCRKSVHDEYFFKDPTRILTGNISPPRFNLRNPVMIRKHIHSAILSKLVSLKQTMPPKEISESEQEEIKSVVSLAFPLFIKQFLLDENGHYRREPIDISLLRKTIEKHKNIFSNVVKSIFSEYWPDEAKTEISPDILNEYLTEIGNRLKETINLIHTRLLWTIYTQNKLLEKKKSALLDEVDTRLLKRCEDYIKSLFKKDLSTYTLNVLSREGFLPGYGIYTGNIGAFAGSAFSTTWRKMSFELNRPSTIAVREFVPGNMIYANGGKYRTALLHLPFGEELINPDEYFIDVDNQKVVEKGIPISGYADTMPISIEGLPICDVDLMFMSHVSDEESNRFRMPVFMVGYLRAEHRGGESYVSSNHEFDFLKGQKVRVVNAGPADKVLKGELGYPICLICGATRSPYQSEREIERFHELHEKICGKKPGRFAITADVQVDGILFKGFDSIGDAINLAEALRIGSNQVLEMDPEDLQILTLPQSAGIYDVFLYDPMTGGSGLLNQLLERWEEIINAGKTSLKSCSNACEKSCYSCMRTYRNIMSHDYLDRRRAVELLEEFKKKPELVHDIPSRVTEPKPSGLSTNLPEARLRQLLLRVGFPPFDAQEEIPIPHKIYKSTTPDLLRIDPVSGVKIAIYLDGLSKDIHGNEERQKIDNLIRTVLRSLGYHVEEISASTLDDPVLLKYHLRSLAKALNAKDIKKIVEEIDLEEGISKINEDSKENDKK